MYDSAIDPYGRILQRAIIREGGRATLIADVPLGTADSIFVELGPWFGWGTLPASIGTPTCRPPPTPTRPPDP